MWLLHQNLVENSIVDVHILNPRQLDLMREKSIKNKK